MKFHVSCHILFSLSLLAQLDDVWSKKLEEREILKVQQKVENLMEKIITFIQDYYKDSKAELKCLPDSVSDDLMNTLKDSITCVEENERTYSIGQIKGTEHSKNFLKCFADAKKGIQGVMKSVNTSIDYCPENITEKTYQINVTTVLTKAFRINIKNGVEITKKEIELDRDTKHCFGDFSKVDEDGRESSTESQTEGGGISKVDDDKNNITHAKEQRPKPEKGSDGTGENNPGTEKPKSDNEKNITVDNSKSENNLTVVNEVTTEKNNITHAKEQWPKPEKGSNETGENNPSTEKPKSDNEKNVSVDNSKSENNLTVVNEVTTEKRMVSSTKATQPTEEGSKGKNIKNLERDADYDLS